MGEELIELRNLGLEPDCLGEYEPMYLEIPLDLASS